VAQFGALGTQELAPGRHVVEQLAYFHGGARRMRARGDIAQLAALDLQRRPVRVAGAARGQGEAADRGDRRQRFATKTERGHGFEVVQAGDLAGGVARHRQRQLLRGDPAAIVTDADQAHAALFQVDVDPGGAGIQCVFHQFLDHRRRPLDDFAGGDLVDQDFRQLADAHAGLRTTEDARAEAMGTWGQDFIGR